MSLAPSEQADTTCQLALLTVKSSVGQTKLICCLAMTSVELQCPMSNGFHGRDSLGTLGRAIIDFSHTTRTDLTHQRWVSPVEVSGSDWNSILGFNMLSGGLISEGKRSVILEFVPRLAGPSFPDLFLEFL